MQNIVQQQFGAKQPDLLSEDFQFIFPVVGPLTKTEFTGAFSSFKVEEAFTGSYNYFGFNVDPMEPNRVWFFSRGVLTHSGVLMFGAMKMKPSGKTIVGPPQVMSMSFNTEGLCYKLTGGYSVDRTVGNTGGLGGVFGLIHAIGGMKATLLLLHCQAQSQPSPTELHSFLFKRAKFIRTSNLKLT